MPLEHPYSENFFYVRATEPTEGVSEGDAWYDTANDVLKLYDGSAWNEISGGGGSDTNVVMLGGGHDNSLTTVTIDCFLAVGTNSPANASTEALHQTKLYQAMNLRDIGFSVGTNTKSSASEGAFRDDGADVTGSVVTITASTTGYFENTGLNVAIASGSLICFRYKGTASGNLNIRACMARLTS